MFSQNFEVVQKFFPKNSYDIVRDSIYQNYNDTFFEDEKYLVSKICDGEWGGAVIFTNKETNENFIAKSTCPVSIVLHRDKYILTSTLNHLGSYSEITEITDPEKLLKISSTTYQGNLNLIPEKNIIRLIKSFDFTILGTFVYKNKLYHVVSNSKGTFISKIELNKFIFIKKISDQRLWSILGNSHIITDDLIISFSDQFNTGFIKISSNKITLFFRK
nr:hypothetical protein [uncultured Flavobacterium sp.]